MNDFFFLCCAGVFAGIYFFYQGFISFRKKRIIENVPTSKIRSMAMGMVEIKGRALECLPLSAPFSQSECTYYSYVVEELRRTKNSTYWAVIHKGDSSKSPFLIEDETGQTTVQPEGAEVNLPESFSFKTGLLQQIPSHVTEFLDARGVRYKHFFGSQKTMRFREWRISPNDEVYVIGVCRNDRENLAEAFRARLQDVIRKVKADPKAMAMFDANGDGNISVEEWEIARQTIERRLGAKMTAEKANTFISKGKLTSDLFLISKMSEKSLLQQLNFKAFGGVFGGAVLTCCCLGYVLFALQNFR